MRLEILAVGFGFLSQVPGILITDQRGLSC